MFEVKGLNSPDGRVLTLPHFGQWRGWLNADAPNSMSGPQKRFPHSVHFINVIPLIIILSIFEKLIYSIYWVPYQAQAELVFSFA